MTSLTMPLIIINMGSEMMYILNQRLQAQTVQDEKARKVLVDVVRAMFSSIFMEELFKPQEMYNNNSTKQVFEKLAHSSIMRLNKSSMDKLFDLMTMGFKYQVLACNSPNQLLHITLHHLDSLKIICKSEEAADLVQQAIDRLISTYSHLSNGQWMLLKYEIMKFFQEKKIKVSLFLQQKIQSMDGTLVLKTQGKLPFGTEKPFKIKYYEDDKVVDRRIFDIGERDDYVESTDILDFSSDLGGNIYEKEVVRSDVTSPSSRACSIYMESVAPYASSGIPIACRKAKSPRNRDSKSSAKAEICMLADLLGIHSAPSKEDFDIKPFKLNLFPESVDSKDGEEKGGSSMIIIDIDAAAESKTMASYMDELSLKDEKADGKYADDDEDDLLALMDSAK